MVQKWFKTHFSKSDPGPFTMLNLVLLAQFEPMVTRFGPWKIGHLVTKKCVKNGSKTHLFQGDPRPFGMLQRVFLAHFEPFLTHFGRWKVPNS